MNLFFNSSRGQMSESKASTGRFPSEVSRKNTPCLFLSITPGVPGWWWLLSRSVVSDSFSAPWTAAASLLHCRSLTPTSTSHLRTALSSVSPFLQGHFVPWIRVHLAQYACTLTCLHLQRLCFQKGYMLRLPVDMKWNALLNSPL